MSISDDELLLPFPDLPPAHPAIPPAPPAAKPAPDAGESFQSTQEEADAAVTDGELADWKADLRRDFEDWLAALDEIPEPDEPAGDDAGEAPDLYSFYEQFAAASAESRKANRRTAEAMSQWGETLARFESGLQPLRETAAQLLAAQPKTGELARPHCLMLVELLDRLHRQMRALASPPAGKRSWWSAGDDTAWRNAWEAQRQALGILVSHLEGWLAKEGVARIDTDGQPFDPALMMAVALEPDATRPPQTVLEELTAGYLRRGELLRPAQVKVSS